MFVHFTDSAGTRTLLWKQPPGRNGRIRLLGLIPGDAAQGAGFIRANQWVYAQGACHLGGPSARVRFIVTP